jgi:hypothetical protein
MSTTTTTTTTTILLGTTPRTDVVSFTVIENYEPSDEGWWIVFGKVAEPPEPKRDDERDEDAPADEES